MNERIHNAKVGLDHKRLQIAEARGRQKLIEEQLAAAQKHYETIVVDLEVSSLCLTLLQEVSDYARRQMVSKMEHIVTSALRTVFGREMTFHITLDTKAGVPVASFAVESDGLTNNPEDSRGGGVMDIISIALRCATMLLYDPEVARVLILDEPGKMVSDQYASGMGYFLKEFSQQTGTQVIMITHNSKLAELADHSYRVEQKNGVSEVIRI